MPLLKGFCAATEGFLCTTEGFLCATEGFLLTKLNHVFDVYT